MEGCFAGVRNEKCQSWGRGGREEEEETAGIGRS